MTSAQDRDATRGAAIAAGGVGAWLLLSLIVEKVLGLIGYSTTSGVDGLFDLGMSPSYWWDIPYRLGVFVLPLALGFFLAWRFVVPITRDLGLARVIGHSVAATGLAATVYFVVKVVADLISGSSMGGPLFGDSMSDIGYLGPSIPAVVFSALQSAVGAFLTLLPLGVLAGILLHHWLRHGSFSRRGDV